MLSHFSTNADNVCIFRLRIFLVCLRNSSMRRCEKRSKCTPLFVHLEASVRCGSTRWRAARSTDWNSAPLRPPRGWIRRSASARTRNTRHREWYGIRPTSNYSYLQRWDCETADEKNALVTTSGSSNYAKYIELEGPETVSKCSRETDSVVIGVVRFSIFSFETVACAYLRAAGLT